MSYSVKYCSHHGKTHHTRSKGGLDIQDSAERIPETIISLLDGIDTHEQLELNRYAETVYPLISKLERGADREVCHLHRAHE